jgi:hypothetical protein
MTDQHVDSPAADKPEPAASEHSEEQSAATDDSIQSLTDYFDQMDRAAFKRVLANRNALRNTANEPPKSQPG